MTKSIFMLAVKEHKCYGHGDYGDELVAQVKYGYFESESAAEAFAETVDWPALEVVEVRPASSIPLKFPTVPERLQE